MSIENVEREVMEKETPEEKKDAADIIEIERPLTDEEIDKKVANFWQAHETIKSPTEKEKKLGITKMPEFLEKCPDVPVFYSITAEQLDSHPERLGEFNKLWQKFILGEAMTESDGGLLETFYRNFLRG